MLPPLPSQRPLPSLRFLIQTHQHSPKQLRLQQPTKTRARRLQRHPEQMKVRRACRTKPRWPLQPSSP